MYEYKFIKVPLEFHFKDKQGDYFNKCKEIIIEEAKNGWKLSQIIVPPNEKTGVYMPLCYQIIFEKQLK